MMKSILAAVDGSEESLAGLEQAVAWAERLSAELRAVFVQDDRRFVTFPTYSDAEGTVPRPIPLEGEALKKAEADAAKEESEVRAAYEGLLKGHSVQASLRMERGMPEHYLLREAHAADMVVLGKRGRGLDANVEGAGPTTETLIHGALRPVLVVPKGGRASGPVLAPFDGSKGVHRVIVPAVQLAAAAKVPITVVTVADTKAEGEEIQAPLHGFFKAHGVQGDFRIVEGRDTERGTARLVLETADELGAGMVAMGAFSVGPIREFFVGSVTREVLAHAPCPVLMMT